MDLLTADLEFALIIVKPNRYTEIIFFVKKKIDFIFCHLTITETINFVIKTMSTYIEQEIARGIAVFVESLKSKGCDISQYYNPDTVAAEIQSRRKMKVSRDSFLNICQYLTLSEMVGLSTICKEFMEYYPHIWNIAQLQLYPESLIPASNYINIRKNIALNYYYLKLNKKKKNSQWVLINKEENIMSKLDKSILASYYYDENTVKSVMDKNELQCRAEIRDNFFHKYIHHKYDYYYYNGCNADLEHMQQESDNLKAYLQCFRFVSKTDSNGILYYTIKQDIDSSLYGWDPVKHPIEYDTKRKWIIGEYHDRYEAIFGNNTNNGSFEYEYDEWGVAIRRYRIRPDYC
jgi:hypothetical protein